MRRLGFQAGFHVVLGFRHAFRANVAFPGEGSDWG